MNMFREQAAAKKRDMEALKAEATTGQAADAGTAKQRAPKGGKGKGGRRKSRNKIVAEQESGAKRQPARRRKTSAKASETPPTPPKEKITRRTSFSFTDSEYERLSRFAHEHYTTMKGVIFWMMDFVEAAEAELEDD